VTNEIDRAQPVVPAPFVVLRKMASTSLRRSSRLLTSAPRLPSAFTAAPKPPPPPPPLGPLLLSSVLLLPRFENVFDKPVSPARKAAAAPVPPNDEVVIVVGGSSTSSISAAAAAASAEAPLATESVWRRERLSEDEDASRGKPLGSAPETSLIDRERETGSGVGVVRSRRRRSSSTGGVLRYWDAPSPLVGERLG
jgi:hypothetical protein